MMVSLASPDLMWGLAIWYPPSALAGSPSSRSNKHRSRALDISLERAEQLRTERTIDGAVIGRQRHLHLGGDGELAVADHGALNAGADAKNRGMGRVDDGGEFLDAIHAEIGDRRRAALIFLRLEPARPGAGGVILHLCGDCNQRFGLGLADHRRDQTTGDCDCDSDIGMPVL